jgi:hypothetical protein
MTEVSSKTHYNLVASIRKKINETMTDTLAATIDDLNDKLEDSEAQDRLDEIVVMAQGRDRASDRLVDVINYCITLRAEYEDEDDEESSGVVDTAPKTRDKE